ncbi:MAG: amidase domain-containing protein [Lentilitoribacter sp.]
MARIQYANIAAISYAKKYCGEENNSCGVYLKGENKSDCAHFLAHCLAAGGIKILNKNPGTAFCKHGLAVRNTDIEAELKQLEKQFDNVKAIGLSDAIVGDIGFLQLERPRHAFMVCEVWNPYTDPFSTPKVWAHSSSRCCQEMDTDWQQWLSSAYRLEDG